MPATNDILDGVDDTWNRVTGGAEIGKLADAVIAQFNPQDPAAGVPVLLQIKKLLAALPADDPVLNEKRQQLDRIIQECLGLTVETTIPNAEVVPGEPLKMHLAATVRSDIVPVRWVAARFPTIKAKFSIGAELAAFQSVSRDTGETLPADTQVSQPYWLREESDAGMFRVADPQLIGRPENPPVFPVEQIFEVGGQTVIIPDQPVQLTADRSKDETRDLTVISPVSLKLGSEVSLFAPNATRPVAVEVTAARPDTAGTSAPERAGWLEGCARDAIVQFGKCRGEGEVDVHRHRAGTTNERRHHRRGEGWRQELRQRTRGDQLSAHPAAVAPAVRPAQSRVPQPRHPGPKHRLPSRRR